MKKYIKILLLVFMGLVQSCTINSETMFHKDQTMSISMEVNAGSLYKMLEDMPNLAEKQSDSVSQKAKMDVKKMLSKEWKSIYQLSEEEGKPIPPDSVKLAKKLFLKGLYTDEKPSGFAIKMEKFSRDDLEEITKHKEMEMVAPLMKSPMDWDGKKLTLDMEQMMSPLGDKNIPKGENAELVDKMLDNLMLLDIQYNDVYRFENKIISVKGKHKNFEKIDDYSVKISFDMKDFGKKQKGKKNKTIVIITE